MITLTLADLAAETQRQIRQESQDFHYSVADESARVERIRLMKIHGDSWSHAIELGSPADNCRRALMLQFIAVQAASTWSANGGIGQVFCWFTTIDRGLEAHWRALKGPAEWFDFRREVGLAA